MKSRYDCAFEIYSRFGVCKYLKGDNVKTMTMWWVIWQTDNNLKLRWPWCLYWKQSETTIYYWNYNETTETTNWPPNLLIVPRSPHWHVWCREVLKFHFLRIVHMQVFDSSFLSCQITNKLFQTQHNYLKLTDTDDKQCPWLRNEVYSFFFPKTQIQK